MGERCRRRQGWPGCPSRWSVLPNDNARSIAAVWGNSVLDDCDNDYGYVELSNDNADDLIGTAELIYSRDVNGIYYINANLPAAQTSFAGADPRPRWTSNRINSNVSNATVLKNQNEGYSWHASASLQKRFRQGFLKGGNSYGESKNTVDPGSIAFGSWTGNAISGDPNNPGVAYSNQFPGHRVFLAGSYRLEYLKFGATTFSFFWQGVTNGVDSYTFAGDLNGDLGASNDLIYIHRDQSEMNFQTVLPRISPPSQSHPSTTASGLANSSSLAGRVND